MAPSRPLNARPRLPLHVDEPHHVFPYSRVSSLSPGVVAEETDDKRPYILLDHCCLRLPVRHRMVCRIHHHERHHRFQWRPIL